MLKFKIATLGCKVNQAESEALAARLRAEALTPSDEQETTDVCIINTCTVTRKAAMQSRQAIRRAIRANPLARILVTGCYAQTAPEEIRRIPGVKAIFGRTQKERLAAAVLDTIGLEPNAHRRLNPDRSRDPQPPLPGIGRRARPFMKVQDGCEAFCSYCIVPYARGPSRSLPLQEALAGIHQIRRAGYFEVVLTGVHLGCYGQDLSPPSNLLDLLDHIRSGGAIERVRLSSIEPGEVSAELIRLAAQATEGSGRICPHFHIPLQSGDDEVLKKMNRPYNSQCFEDVVHEINGRLPDAAIGVDILVGFPGETAAAFERTCRLVEKLPVTYLHVFPFSPRKGTPAYSMPNRVPPAMVKERCRFLREIGKRKRTHFYRRFVDRTLEVIIEERHPLKSGYLKGTSANYIPVYVKTAGDSTKRFAPQQVAVEKVTGDINVYGRPV